MERNRFLAALAFGGALMAADVTAAPITLNLQGGSTAAGVKSYMVGGVSVTATGWADTRNPDDNRLQRGNIYTWAGSGIGLCNQDELSHCSSPQHAVDNLDDHDMVLLTFSEAVVLDAFKLGWIYNDSDVTLLAFGGEGEYSLNNQQWSQLVGDDWIAVGDYFDNGTNTTATGTAVASTQWLIGAYNGLFGADDFGTSDIEKQQASESGKGKRKDKHKDKTPAKESADSFKLSHLTFSLPELPPPPPQEVPEPGSLALFAMGALGLAAARRRRRD